MPISLLIVEDEAEFGALLERLFVMHDGFGLVELVDDVGKAAALLERRRFDVVLTDYRLPSGSGLELVGGFNDRLESPSFVVMTSFDSDAVLLESYSLGAMSYVPKLSSPDTLVSSVLRAAKGLKSASDSVIHRLLEASIGAPEVRENHRLIRQLSEKDRRILGLVLEGQSNSEIARSLHYAESTIKETMTELFSLFNVRSRARLIARLRATNLGNRLNADTDI